MMAHSCEIKGVPLRIVPISVVICLLACMCSSLSCGSFNRQTETASPTLTPRYSPLLSGRVFVTTQGELHAIPFWSVPGFGFYGGHYLFSKANGTPVEIIQAAWIALPGDPGCYYYLVRTDDGGTGWVDGQALTSDLSQPSPEICGDSPPPKIKPVILDGSVYVTTLGSQKDEVDFWSGPTLDEGDSHYLFSKPHGTQVKIIENHFFLREITKDRLGACHNYLVRTEDGLEGWVAGSSLTKDLSQPSSEQYCAK